MKSVPFSLNGKEYKLCFTLGLLMEVIEERGNISNLLDAIGSEEITVQMNEVFNFGARLIKAGAEREKELRGAGNEISAEDLRKGCDAADYFDLRRAINNCFKKGAKTTTNIEVPEDAPKN